ncbi:MAG: 8-amino-7-oxononanoate synthase [Thiobacillus sp.]
MSHAALNQLTQKLAALRDDHLERRRGLLESSQGVRIRLDGRDLLSFCSNDYLGLAASQALIRAGHAALDACGLGSGASHLISGHHTAHHAFETTFAQFVRKPAALLFSSGYMANLGVLGALLGRHDEVFADRLNHASLNDAAQLSGAKFTRYRHADLTQLEAQLARSEAKIKMIASDLVFSMDGDIVPVDALLELADRYDAWLYLDDAHGFGVLNAGRGGMTEKAAHDDRVIYLATLGKAAGVAGAAVAADASVIEWLIQKSRPYIYTTAMPPMLAACLSASLKEIAEGEARRVQLRQHATQLRAALHDLRWKLLRSDTPIQPLIVGDNGDAVALSEALLERGILVPAIRTPTVPQGSARLRITLTAAHTAEDVDQLTAALHDV